jgi:hypothetical protein
MPDGHSEHDLASVRVAISGLQVKLEERFSSHREQIERLSKELTEVTRELHSVQVKIASYTFFAGLISAVITTIVVKFLSGSMG